MKKNIFRGLIAASLGLTMAVGISTGIAANKKAKPVYAADSGLSASDGTFIIDFYDSDKLSSTSGTGLTNNNYSSFVKVATGLTKTNVVTGVSVTGTVQYGKNGGLTAGTGTAASADTHYVTFTIGSDYAVNRCTVYATAYESGRWKLNGNVAGSGSVGSKGATFSNVTTPLVWEGLNGQTSLTFKKDDGSNGNQKRLTIYTIVCEYGSSGGGDPIPVDGVTVTLNRTSANLDVNGNNTISLTATATATGNATTGLTAVSDHPSIANVSTSTPTSNVAFTITALSAGTATITVASSWNPEVTASFTVNVIDTTPRPVSFKKIDSIENGQTVLITTVVDGTYYYFSSATSTGSAPAAVECEYDLLNDRLRDVDANMAFTVSGDSSAWQFTSPSGDKIYVSGNDNNRIRVGDPTANNSFSPNFTVNETASGYYIQNNSYTRFFGVYNHADWRSYNSRTAANYKGQDNNYNCDWITFWVEVTKPSQTLSGNTEAYSDETVALASTATNPNWSIVVGDTTATGAAITSAGVLSVTGPGSVKVKATHNDYDDAYYVVTFTERPSQPYIEPEKSSTTGFTGQNEIIAFSYGSLNTGLVIESSNTSIVTVNTPSTNGMSGTVQINFVAAGSANILFKDGNVEIDHVSVTVTQSTVTITGLPATSNVFVNGTLNLYSTVTVTATGSCTNAVTWESADSDIAEVNSSGVVTGKAIGTVDITVSSVSYPSATMTCSVSVVRSSFVSADTFQNGKRYIIAAVGSTDANKLFYLPAGTEAVANNPSASEITSMANLTKEDAWLATVDASGHIVFSNTYDNNTYYLTAIDNAQGISISTSNEGYWVLDGTGLKYSDGGSRHLGTNGDSSFRYYSSLNSGQKYAQVFYEYVPTAREQVEELKTQASLAYANYNNEGDETFTFENLGIRFGGIINGDMWTALDTECSIEGYGVFLSTTSFLGSETIEEWYNDCKTELNTIDEAITEMCEDDYVINFANTNTRHNPSLKSNPSLIEGNYKWMLYNKIAANALTEEYVAVAYIRINNDIVFLQEERASAKSLAYDMINVTHEYESDAFGGSLNYLATRP